MIPSLEQLHHAIIFTGNREKQLEVIKKYFADNDVDWQGNPDVIIFDQEQLLMDEAQIIITFVSSKKLGEHRFCILSIDRMAPDVQNRLLKSIEEPQPGTYFFIILPTLDRVLPTIISRCQIITGEEGVGETRLSVQNFLAMTTSERFSFVESWTKAKKDEDNVSKSEISYFLDHLEKYLWEKGIRTESLFSEIRVMRQYVGIRGASHRVILDYISMICPLVK